MFIDSCHVLHMHSEHMLNEREKESMLIDMENRLAVPVIVKSGGISRHPILARQLLVHGELAHTLGIHVHQQNFDDVSWLHL